MVVDTPGVHHLLAATVYLPLVHPVVACSVQQSLKSLPHVLQWAAASRDFARTLPRRMQSANQDVAALLQEILALLRDKAVQAGSWVAFAVNHPTAAAGECPVGSSPPGAHQLYRQPLDYSSCSLIMCRAAQLHDRSWTVGKRLL